MFNVQIKVIIVYNQYYRHVLNTQYNIIILTINIVFRYLEEFVVK